MFNDSQNLATSIPPRKFMFGSTLREPRYSCAPPLDASAGTVSTFMARACLIIILVLPYSLYAQSRPVMLSVSARNHTHGADGRTRTGGQLLTRQLLYQLSYISKKECPILPASEPGGRRIEKDAKDFNILGANSSICSCLHAQIRATSFSFWQK